MLELKRFVTVGFVLLSLLAGSVLPAAGPARGERDLPRFYSPRGLDGTPVTLGDVTGRSWAAWSYWSGRESAIAMSTRDTDGRWSEFIKLHPEASVFHSPGWMEALNRTYGYESFALTTTR